MIGKGRSNVKEDDYLPVGLCLQHGDCTPAVPSLLDPIESPIEGAEKVYG